MNTDADNSPNGATAGNAPEAILRITREERQLSVEDVSQTLRLTPEAIIALETGDYAALGPAVFVRGYLRNYAKLLDIPLHQVLGELPVADVEPEEFRTMSLRTEVKQGVNLHRWLLWSLVGLVLLIALIIIVANLPDAPEQRPTATNVPANDSAAETLQAKPAAAVANGELGSAADEEQPDAEVDSAAVPESTPSSESDATETGNLPDAASNAAGESVDAVVESSTPAAESVAATAEELPPAITSATPGMVQLRLTFSDECWIEVADSRRSLLYGLEKGGKVVDLEGVPPFKLFVGNREAVKVSIAGKPFAIPAGLDGDNTARFTIDEDPS